MAAGAGVAAASDPEKMTICHKPGSEAGRTMEVPRSAWSGHQQHGDHEGACTSREARPPPPPSSNPERPIPRTQLSISERGDGDLDGDATFDLAVANEGSADAKDLKVAGTLRGDGAWSVRSTEGARCTIDQGRLACSLADLRPGTELTLRLSFDGHLEVCDTASIDLVLTAANDASSGDDRARESVRTGACSPLDARTTEPLVAWPS
ncbi:MAG: hypothetical protein ACYC2H_08485 [Thermoplasmatota archaeon]